MDNDPLIGVNTDELEKKDGKWQFRDERTKAEDECGQSPAERKEIRDWREQSEEENGRSY